MAALAVLLSVGLLSGRAKIRVDGGKLLDDIRYLTSAPLGGRNSGSAGLQKAADYVASVFAQAGVKPVPGKTYYQQFPVTVGALIGPGTHMSWAGSAGTKALDLHNDYEPYAFSAANLVRAGVVFVGYGITACEYGYDDYAGLDVRGKAVIMLRHEPQEYEVSSVFEGRVYTEHSQLLRKMLTAKTHGAAAVLLVNDTATHSGPDNLEKLSFLPSPGAAGIPFAGIRSGIVETWIASAGHDFAAIQSDIDKNLQPISFEIPGIAIELRTNVVSEQRNVANVVGYVPGTTSEYLVVGAHYDHLGNGEQFSLSADHNGAMHPGADDNASGTAAVLAIARWFGAQPPMRRGVVLVAFAGEEVGLLGSTWFTHSPPLPLGSATAMLNMDMIGRMREKSLTVGGVESGSGLRSVVESVAKAYPFELQTGSQAVYGSSDHTAFLAHGIPSLFFFTGLHADYHRPSDTADKIEKRNTALIADMVAEITASLAEAPTRPVFRRQSSGAGVCPEQIIPHTATALRR